MSGLGTLGEIFPQDLLRERELLCAGIEVLLQPSTRLEMVVQSPAVPGDKNSEGKTTPSANRPRGGKGNKNMTTTTTTPENQATPNGTKRAPAQRPSMDTEAAMMAAIGPLTEAAVNFLNRGPAAPQVALTVDTTAITEVLGAALTRPQPAVMIDAAPLAAVVEKALTRPRRVKGDINALRALQGAAIGGGSAALVTVGVMVATGSTEPGAIVATTAPIAALGALVGGAIGASMGPAEEKKEEPKK